MKTYKCDVCQQKFTSPGPIRWHKIKEHPETVKPVEQPAS